jgi:hypothetical protein
VQLTELASFEAVIVTRSPELPPLEIDIVGVESVVTLSVFELPESEEVAKSGAPGVLGALVSTVRLIDELADETFPYASVNVAETLQVPSESVGRSHDDAGKTYVHVLVVPPLVAEIVTVSPLLPPEAEKVGVVSFVTLSVGEPPESDAAAKSGTPGIDGDATTVTPSVDPEEETFPAESVSVALVVHEPVDKVGKSHEVLVPIV